MENALQPSNEPTILNKWDSINFEGKGLYECKENGEVYITQTDIYPTRLIATLEHQTFEPVIKTLLEKYQDVKQQHSALDQEWSASNDRVRLAAKIEKFKDYILKVPILGNVQYLIDDLSLKEREIQKIYEHNSEVRQQIVNKALALKDSDQWKEATQAYKDIIEEWKNSPVVPKEKMETLWQQIEDARNHFYENKRKNQEAYESQMMHNLDLKLELCEKAEILSSSEEWKDTTQKYKELNEEWKTIGRVASAEKNEELWNRFISAQNIFFDRKKENFERINAEQDQNLTLKKAIVEKAVTLQNNTNWKETTQALAQLTEEWKQIGRVPKEEADTLWQSFQQAKDYFFNKKREHIEQHKLSLEDNYAKKSALVSRIQKLQHSTNWRETTEEINELMNEWKQIGQVPIEHKDKLWESFITARNEFFKRKDANREQRKQQFYNKIDGRIEQTQSFLEKLKFQQEDDQNKIVEFKENIQQLDADNPKDQELKKHLEQLIRNIEFKLPQRVTKIQEVEAQLNELLAKKAEIDTANNPNT